MISIRINHRAGLCSLWTIAASHMLKMPDDEEVHVYATSPLYAPDSDNIWDWFFRNPPPPNARPWPDAVIDVSTYPFNTKLGEDRERLAALRTMARRRFRPNRPKFSKDELDQWEERDAVGIHYRGTDKITEMPRIPYEAVLQAYKTHGDGRPVFLATDEQAAAEWFAQRIPGLIVNPHQRVNGAEGVHTVCGGRQQADEAMRDLYCLSLCSTLLLGRGNFSDFAAIFASTWDIHYHENFQ